MDMAAIAAHYRRQMAEYRRKNAAHAQWANARTFGEAGELTAQFIEGTLRYHPNGHSDGPDEETAEIGPSLAAVNRAGCVTISSQPGCDEAGWRQRAAVEMLVVDPGIRVRLRAGCEQAGLIYNEARPRRWRRDYEAAQLATEHQVNGQWQPCTDFGSTVTWGDVGNELAHSAASKYAARHAWQVSIIDPEWGRNDRFTAALDEFSGRQAPEAGEAAAPSGSGWPMTTAADRRAFWFKWRRAERTARLACRAGVGEAWDEADEALEDTYDRLTWPQFLWLQMYEGRRFRIRERNRDRANERPPALPEEANVLPQSERAKGVEARTHGWDGKPLSEADKRFFALRDSGYAGPIDQDGNKANCLVCDRPGCTRQGLAGKCNGEAAAETPHCYHCGRDLPGGRGCFCDGAARTATDPTGEAPGSSGHNNSGTGRDNTGGTMSVDLDVPTTNGADASTLETLARALRDTADNARRSAADKAAQAESLRAQASALADKHDMSESAQGLLDEAARLDEVADGRLGIAAAYEDKAAQVDAQRSK